MECTSYQPEKSIQKISLTPFKTVFRKNNVEKSRCTVPKHQVTFFSKTLDIERDSRVLSVKSFCGGVHDITCHLGKKSSSYLSVTVIYIYWVWPPTRIITFSVGDPYKPSFTTGILGGGIVVGDSVRES